MNAAMAEVAEHAFTLFVEDLEPRLRRAFVALRGAQDGREATAEALAWAWTNWEQVQQLDNPAGYLYRVGASRTAIRTRPTTPVDLSAVSSMDREHHFEPGLSPALARLSERQRSVVVLICGCEWTHQEVADALELSRSSVGTHLDRALAALRAELGVETNG